MNLFSQATQKIQSSKDTEVSPSNDDQAVSKSVPGAEDKNMVKNEQPSDRAVNGKGTSLVLSFLIDNGPMGLNHMFFCSRMLNYLAQMAS